MEQNEFVDICIQLIKEIDSIYYSYEKSLIENDDYKKVE